MGASWRAILAPPGASVDLALGGAKMALQETPIKYGGMAPYFGSFSFICADCDRVW